MKIRKIRILEFFVIGIGVGLLEDILAIIFATDAKITPRVVFIAVLVAIPFAFLSELIVDRPDFWKALFPRKLYKKFKKRI